jgi:hypothetical protein
MDCAQSCEKSCSSGDNRSTRECIKRCVSSCSDSPYSLSRFSGITPKMQAALSAEGPVHSEVSKMRFFSVGGIKRQ